MDLLGRTDLRSALVIAHPAHELRVYRWMEVLRPRVHVLTDGSGRTARSRLKSTHRVVADTQATPGAIFGRLTDRAVYRAALHSEVGLFVGLADELAASFIADDVDVVMGDTEEGEFMTHELWRAVRIAAVRGAARVLGKAIRHYEFVVDGDPRNTPDFVQDGVVALPLDDYKFDQKLAAGRSYPEIAPLVEDSVQRFGLESFRTERLFPCNDDLVPRRSNPGYEQRGEELVAQGVYPEVIRRDLHLLPIFARLDDLTRAA